MRLWVGNCNPRTLLVTFSISITTTKLWDSNYSEYHATTSRVIRGLIDKGYVERFKLEGNKKEYRLSLSQSGKLLLERVLPIVVGLRKKGMNQIPKKDFAVFLSVLEQIAANYSP